jgi:hypothetical protein
VPSVIFARLLLDKILATHIERILGQRGNMSEWVATASGAAAVVSAVVAFFAARYSRPQARAAHDQVSAANDFARQLGQSEAVIHFTSRFFDLMRDGTKFDQPQWEYQF